MADYKYPYIKGGKAMVAAVLGACSYIRKTGYFNKAVKYYANKYNVDEEELAANIRERQGAGQKGKKSKSQGRKYHWFIVCEQSWSDAEGYSDYYRPQILKGLSEKTIKSRFCESDNKRTMREDTGSSYSPVYNHIVIAEFDSEEQAREAFPKWEELAKEHENKKGLW